MKPLASIFALAFVLACSNNETDGGSSGRRDATPASSAVPPESDLTALAAAAAIRYSACYDSPPTAELFAEVLLPNSPDNASKAARIACVAAASSCDEVRRRCLEITATGECTNPKVSHCDGNSRIGCWQAADGTYSTTRIDCTGTSSPFCVEEGNTAMCSEAPSCSESTGSEGVLTYCSTGQQTVDCAAFGLECSDRLGTPRCVSSEPCFRHCVGSAIRLCPDAGAFSTVDLDCGALGSKWSCSESTDQVGGQAGCDAVDAECTPNGYSKCSGDTLKVCVFGAWVLRRTGHLHRHARRQRRGPNRRRGNRVKLPEMQSYPCRSPDLQAVGRRPERSEFEDEPCWWHGAAPRTGQERSSSCAHLRSSAQIRRLEADDLGRAKPA